MRAGRVKGKSAGMARRAFLLRNAAALAGALVSPLFGGLLRRAWKGTPAGREGKYYRKVEGDR